MVSIGLCMWLERLCFLDVAFASSLLMDHSVAVQVASLSEPPTALIALERLLTSVDANMDL